MEVFSFNPPINISVESKWPLLVTSFEATNFLFKTTNEKNSFSISIPGAWRNPNFLPKRFIDNLRHLLKLRCQNDIELHVQEVRKRGDKTKTK